MGYTHSLPVTLKIRHDLSTAWTTANPVLAQGEYGLEDDTFLLKIGDGSTAWNSLRYLNKLDSSYFKYLSDGTVTFSDSFQSTINNLINASTGTFEQITITNAPVNNTDATNKAYVDQAIAQAGHLKRRKVNTLPAVADADENTIYLVPHGSDGTTYDEYLLIDGVFDLVGSLDGGSVELEIATAYTLGGVKSSNADNYIAVEPQTGFMTLNRVSTSLLYVPVGDELVLYGGHA